jgi:hypothetical protein
MDFEKTLIDVSSESAVKQFAALHSDLESWVQSREDGLKSLKTNEIIKYIVCCYDKESPLVYSYKKRWVIKKRESAIYAQFPKEENGDFNVDAEKIIFCQNDVINRVILRYLYLLHDRMFQTYVIYSEMLLKQSAELMRGEFQQPAHAKAAKENYDVLNSDIEELESKIFSGEETKKMKDLLYEESSNMFNDLRPERIAIRLEEGLPPIDFNPYGSYKKKKMVFMGDE